jgi:hypothetical protein
MAAPWNPPKRAEDFEFEVCLEDMANPGLFKNNPTLAAGDVTIVKDHATGAPANLATLPTVLHTSYPAVKVPLSATEMTADVVTVRFHDLTVPPEWADWSITILTTA